MCLVFIRELIFQSTFSPIVGSQFTIDVKCCIHVFGSSIMQDVKVSWCCVCSPCCCLQACSLGCFLFLDGWFSFLWAPFFGRRCQYSQAKMDSWFYFWIALDGFKPLLNGGLSYSERQSSNIKRAIVPGVWYGRVPNTTYDTARRRMSRDPWWCKCTCQWVGLPP